jgi:hypothetical protein
MEGLIYNSATPPLFHTLIRPVQGVKLLCAPVFSSFQPRKGAWIKLGGSIAGLPSLRMGLPGKDVNPGWISLK